MMKSALQYYGGAALLNACWYPVLLLPLQLREALYALELTVPEKILLLELAGLSTAAVFRNAIIGARGLNCLVLGAILPFFGMLVFVVAMLMYMGVQGRLGGGDIGLSLVYGPVFTLMGAWVVVPMGIISEFVMRWLGRQIRAESTGSP